MRRPRDQASYVTVQSLAPQLHPMPRSYAAGLGVRALLWQICMSVHASSVVEQPTDRCSAFSEPLFHKPADCFPCLVFTVPDVMLCYKGFSQPHALPCKLLRCAADDLDSLPTTSKGSVWLWQPDRYQDSPQPRMLCSAAHKAVKPGHATGTAMLHLLLLASSSDLAIAGKKLLLTGASSSHRHSGR